MRRVVIDSNVLISARLSPRGSPGRLLAAWLDGRFELIAKPSFARRAGRRASAPQVPTLAYRG